MPTLSIRLSATIAIYATQITLISTVGLVGLAAGPVTGGLVLGFAPWQALLVVNAPIAMVARLCIRFGAPADKPNELHDVPIDIPGALIGTMTIFLALLAPTLLVELGAASTLTRASGIGAIAAAGLFVTRERATRNPLLDLALVARNADTRCPRKPDRGGSRAAC
jgi:hypothetical protein